MNSLKNIKETLLSLDNLPIYIAGHIKPDQDSICSSIALAEWLISQGRQAFVLIKSGDEALINWFGNYKYLKHEIVSKDYYFIALDVNDMKRLGEFYEGFKKAKNSINIDHHQGNSNEADLVISKPKLSSTCEIIYKIIKPDGLKRLPKDICALLYSGMMNDTNCFSRRLSSSTMKIAQKLINEGIDYSDIIKQTYSNRTLYSFRALAKIVSEMKIKDGVYYSVVDKSLAEFKELSHNQIVKQIAEDIRKIDSIDVYIMLIKDGENIIGKVMTNISNCACDIAEVFGGGGHKKEAGFSIKNIEVEQIIENVINYLKNKA